MKTILIALLSSLTLAHSNGFDIPKRKIPLENHMSTKTPYRFIENPDISEIHYENCKPTKIWGMIRHGTRTPGTEIKKDIEGRLPDIRQMILESNENNELEELKKWTVSNFVDGKKTLTHEGEDEMINLGERFMKRFPSLLPEEWDNSTYLFRHTNTQRTGASARYFTKGIFGGRISNHVWFPEPKKHDPILRFYKACDKWRHHIKENPETVSELEKYLTSSSFNDVVKNITARWNLPEDSLSTTDVRLIYTTCCFETAWNKYKRSPWCNLLTAEDAEALEYAEDLEYYWIDGYGYDLTTKIACRLFQDLIKHLRDDSQRDATFYFSHSGTILKFLAHLGLFRDETELLHDGFHKHRNRAWKTSRIDVFSSNMVFVRFDCTDGPKILFLFQERPVKLPGCPTDHDLCDLATVEETYKRHLFACDFDRMCSEDESFFKKWTSRLWSIFI